MRTEDCPHANSTNVPWRVCTGATERSTSYYWGEHIGRCVHGKCETWAYQRSNPHLQLRGLCTKIWWPGCKFTNELCRKPVFPQWWQRGMDRTTGSQRCGSHVGTERRSQQHRQYCPDSYSP